MVICKRFFSLLADFRGCFHTIVRISHTNTDGAGEPDSLQEAAALQEGRAEGAVAGGSGASGGDASAGTDVREYNLISV